MTLTVAYDRRLAIIRRYKAHETQTSNNKLKCQDGMLHIDMDCQTVLQA